MLNNATKQKNSLLLRDLLAFIFIPVIQREIDIFCNEIWNTHRIRQQKDTQMPKGVSDHVFNFPEIYGAENVVNTNFNTVCCNLLYNVLHAWRWKLA